MLWTFKLPFFLPNLIFLVVHFLHSWYSSPLDLKWSHKLMQGSINDVRFRNLVTIESRDKSHVCTPIATYKDNFTIIMLKSAVPSYLNYIYFFKFTFCTWTEILQYCFFVAVILMVLLLCTVKNYNCYSLHLQLLQLLQHLL